LLLLFLLLLLLYLYYYNICAKLFVGDDYLLLLFHYLTNIQQEILTAMGGIKKVWIFFEHEKTPTTKWE